jgi:hypothetical protein
MTPFLPANTASPSQVDVSSGLSIGAKAGIGIAAAAVTLGVLGAVVWMFCWRRKAVKYSGIGLKDAKPRYPQPLGELASGVKSESLKQNYLAPTNPQELEATMMPSSEQHELEADLPSAGKFNIAPPIEWQEQKVLRDPPRTFGTASRPWLSYLYCLCHIQMLIDLKPY